MTEEQIKEMLNGIINNGEKWECRCSKQESCSDCNYSCVENKIWQPYKLGEGIHEDWEYRKCEKWFVFEVKENEYLVVDYKISVCKYPFEGTKEECEKWIEEHTKKSWLEEKLSFYDQDCESEYNEGGKDGYKAGAKEVCKKILEEVRNNCFDSWLPIVRDDVGNVLEHLIKELGIEL